MMNDEPRGQGASRLKLALVGAVFLVPVIIAVILGLVGWQPHTRSHGQPLLPQRSFTGIAVRLPDGSDYAWRADRPRMTLVALAGPDCAQRCLRTLALMRNARITLNDKMDHLRLLYLGTPPRGAGAQAVMPAWQVGHDVDGRLNAFRPQQNDSVSALLVESNGTALTYYPAGFDVNGLDQDMHKVLR